MSKRNKMEKLCKKANHVCDKAQYKEASLWEKIKLTIHLLYCKACRSYSIRNEKLTKSINGSNIECMPEEDKSALKNSFSEAIKELQN